MVLGLIEHEVPAHELIHLLELKKGTWRSSRSRSSWALLRRASASTSFSLDDARLISVLRDGKAEIAVGSTKLQAGDQVLAILEPGQEDDLRRLLLKG